MSFLTRRALGRLGLIQPTRATLNSHFCHNVLTRRFNSTETSAETPAETPAETVPQSLRETGLRDEVPELILDEGRGSNIDWSRSFHGLSIQPFPQEIVDILQVPVNMDEVEMRPEGLVYLPEIAYVKILTQAFGPGGWIIAPRGETVVVEQLVTREYALICHGRLVSIARGEKQYTDPSEIPAAMESCKLTALMRCCKDLGVASELWNPRWIKLFQSRYCKAVVARSLITKRKRRIWLRKGDTVEYPYEVVTD